MCWHIGTYFYFISNCTCTSVLKDGKMQNIPLRGCRINIIVVYIIFLVKLMDFLPKTVGRCEHVLISDDGTAAKELPLSVPQRRHPRIFVLTDFAATHNPRSGISNTARCAQCVIIRINATVIILKDRYDKL